MNSPSKFQHWWEPWLQVAIHNSSLIGVNFKTEKKMPQIKSAN